MALTGVSKLDEHHFYWWLNGGICTSVPVRGLVDGDRRGW